MTCRARLVGLVSLTCGVFVCVCVMETTRTDSIPCEAHSRRALRHTSIRVPVQPCLLSMSSVTLEPSACPENEPDCHLVALPPPSADEPTWRCRCDSCGKKAVWMPDGPWPVTCVAHREFLLCHECFVPSAAVPK